MQLRLIRFYLLILLSVSLIHVEALEKLSSFAALTQSPTAMPFQQVSSSFWANDEKVLESPRIDGLVDQSDPESRGTQLRRDTQKRPGGKTNTKATTFSPNHFTTLLAEKFAQDALQSKEMQDTIKELISLNSDYIKHQEMSKEAETIFQPTVPPHKAGYAVKTIIKSKDHGKHKVQGNRKYDRHRKSGRKHRNSKRRLKRHHSKKESSKTADKKRTRKSINRGKQRGLKGKFSSEKSVICRRKRSDQIAKTRKIMEQRSSQNLQPYMNVNKNFIAELKNLESTHRKYKSIPVSQHDEKERDVVNKKRSHMIAQLMLTTTSDPTKKKPGDQGVEYSEYYNDNDDVLLQDIKTQSKLNEAVKTPMEEQIRSVRDTADEKFPDRHYYDSLNEQLLEEDGERLKRNDQKFVRVMEEPSNSIDYVDNTYVPVQATGVVDNEKIPQYLNYYNYIPDQHNVLGNPSKEVVGPSQLPINQFSSDGHVIFNKNPSIIQSPPVKGPSNTIPLMANKLNANQMINNAQLSQPRLVEGNLPYYSVSEMPLEHSTRLLTSPVAFSISTSPVKKAKDLSEQDLSRLYAATSVVTSSSLSGLSPTYDNSKRSNKIFGYATLGKETSVASASPKASLTNFRITPSRADINSAFLNSPEIFSQLRDIRPEMFAPNVRYSNDNEGVEITQCTDQIGQITSRETAAEGLIVKKGKKNDSHVTKADVHVATTVSDINEVENDGLSMSAKDINMSPMTSSQTSVIPESSCSTPGSANTTLTTNETKAVANEILTEIIDELEQLRLENPKNEQREGLPCRLTGSWVTARAGVRFDMTVTNHSVQVSLDYLTPPITIEGLLNVTWNVTGFAPFKRGAPFTLLATNNHTKTLAVFVGSCKVCQGVDTIEGSWMVSREPRDCRDFQMSTSIFNEIFRRTRLYASIKDKQSKHETQVSNTTVTTTSGNSSTSESTSTVREVPDHLGKSNNQSLELNGME